MILIDNILLEEDVLSSYFACDLQKCKGACCTFEGEYGAPVLDMEVGLMEKNLDSAKGYLSERSLDYIEKHGIIEGFQGSYTTVCINNRDCVFVYYESDVAFCALEKAYFDGKSDFRKPISCHLFPIRVRNTFRECLHYQQIPECKSAVANGKRNKIELHKSLEEALIRAYGKDWYDLLSNYFLELQKEK